MTTTDDTTRGRSLTTQEAEAVLLVRGGRTRESAATEARLTVEEVDAALEYATRHRSQRIVPVNVPAPRPPRLEQPASLVRAAVAQKEPDGIDALLRWAEGSDMPRAQTLASRARGIVDELLELHNRGEKVRVAQKTIKVLEQQLKRAKIELREASGKTPAALKAKVPDDPASRDERAQIRAWARENGHTVAERGKIPEPVAAAYRAAMART